MIWKIDFDAIATIGGIALILFGAGGGILINLFAP
jgi:hypothetical protein